MSHNGPAYSNTYKYLCSDAGLNGVCSVQTSYHGVSYYIFYEARAPYSSYSLFEVTAAAALSLSIFLSLQAVALFLRDAYSPRKDDGSRDSEKDRLSRSGYIANDLCKGKSVTIYNKYTKIHTICVCIHPNDVF